MRPRGGRKGDNWSISFSPVVCYHPDCSHCYSEVVKPEEPYIIISGLSLQDREVTKANKKFQKKRKRIATIREKQNYVETLKVLNATWEVFDATDEVDDGDVQIKMKRWKIKKQKIEVSPNQITPIPKGTMARCVHALCSNYATWSIKPGSAGRPTFCDFHKDYWVSVKPI